MSESTATRILRNRIVLFFDFDDTLGPSTTKTLFDQLSLDYAPFQEKLNAYMDEHWHYALAKAELFREWSHRDNSPIRKAAMEKVGQHYPLFEGVDDFIDRLKEYAAAQDESIQLEFVMLTAGFMVIPAATSIAKKFDRLYAGALIFDEEGRILGAKRIITHADKVHYVRQLKEGLDLNRVSDLENTFIDHDPQNDYVPMSQIIYVGDGSSDMSAFQIVEEGGGIAIAIDPSDGKWEGYQAMEPDRRVHNVAEAHYTSDSELYRSLELSVDRCIAEIKLLRLGKHE